MFKEDADYRENSRKELHMVTWTMVRSADYNYLFEGHTRMPRNKFNIVNST